MSADVRIDPYDPGWPARFGEERALLEGVLDGWITGGIHHAGSTAVPGLAAKPVIDILVGVAGLDRARPCIEPLAGLGYLYAPYRPDEMLWFCKPSPERRTHHLHIVPTGSPRFRAELGFRDHLRAHRLVAADYEALKRELAERFPHDREAYTEAKSDFVRGVVAAHEEELAERAREVEALRAHLVMWARGRPDVRALAIVGSWARGGGRLDADLDVIVLAASPEQMASSEEWLGELGLPPVVERRQWGPIAERRVRLPSGLEVELGVGPASWASSDPLDPGTRGVVRDGLLILHDPEGLLEAARLRAERPATPRRRP
ncbi:MAG: hypothetical protein QOG86_2105 [Thermoleophilaceae bacterium]|nr:hypothetical protein [Thermoleophilaceae bacterium]